MLRKIKMGKSDLLTNQEKSAVLAGDCAIACRCSMCGAYLAHNDSDDKAGG